MIHSGQQLFGRPIAFIEPAETLDGDKNLPAVEVDADKVNAMGDEAAARLDAISGYSRAVVELRLIKGESK